MTKREVIKAINRTIAIYKEAIETGNYLRVANASYCSFCIALDRNCKICPNATLERTIFLACTGHESMPEGFNDEEEAKHRITVLQAWKKSIQAKAGRISLREYQLMQRAVDFKRKE